MPGNAEPAYISFDMRLRRLESRVCSLINASGSFFAARRELCRRWDDAMSSDFFVPLRCIEAGFEVVCDPQARGYIGAVSADREFGRKVRTIVHGIAVLLKHWRVMNPFVYGIAALELVSHKLFRWLLPVGMALLLLANVAAWNCGYGYQVFLVIQILGLISGCIGLALPPSRRFSLFQISGFVLLGNLATAKAWYEFCLGRRYVSWQPSCR